MKTASRRYRSRAGLKVAGLALGSALALAGLAAGTVYVAYQQIGASYDLAKLSQAPARSDIFDANGRLLTRMQNNGSRLTVKLKDVSPHLIDAMRLDDGVMVRELVRDAFTLGDGSLHRRLVARAVAGRIQARYSRDEILEFYLNRTYLGAGIYGVEAAARKYFGKPSADLTLAEAAALAGLRRDEGRETLAGRDAVLDRMAARGDISSAAAAAAKSAPTPLDAGRLVSAQDDEIAAAVRGELDRAVPAEQIKRGGLRIYTTIDPAVQRLAAQAIDEQITQMESAAGYTLPTRAGYAGRAAQGDKNAPDYLQGALAAIDNRTGAIVALAGGRGCDESRTNRALNVRRPVGSAFQPFVYAAALSLGLPEQEETERPVGFTRISNNARAPQAALEAVQTLARRVGFDQAEPTPASVRGQLDATPKELAAAYTVFPNKGVVRAPYLIERVDSADGGAIYLADHSESRAFDERTAQFTSIHLVHAAKGGASSQKISLELSAPIVGQPGVSAGSKDAWFVGYTSSLTCAVWVGLDQPRPITARNDGVNPALPIWTEFMRETVGSAKRYPALALAGAEAPAATVVPAAFSYTEPTAAKPADLPPKIQQAIAPEPEVSTAPPAGEAAPLSSGSRYIRDGATGRVIGIDSSVGAAEAELIPVRVASPVMVRRAQPVTPGGVPPSNDPADQTTEAYGFTGASPASLSATPVRRALPVAPTRSFDVSAWRAANLEASRTPADPSRVPRVRAAGLRYP